MVIHKFNVKTKFQVGATVYIPHIENNRLLIVRGTISSIEVEIYKSIDEIKKSACYHVVYADPATGVQTKSCLYDNEIFDTEEEVIKRVRKNKPEVKEIIIFKNIKEY